MKYCCPLKAENIFPDFGGLNFILTFRISSSFRNNIGMATDIQFRW